MVRVSGPLVNVTTSASSVRDVQVHTKKVRAWGDGLMTPDPSQATLSNGVVEFEAAPGPVVMVLFMAEAGAETVSLVVGEGTAQSLADAYRDGQMASDRDAGELAGILEQIRDSVGVVTGALGEIREGGATEVARISTEGDTQMGRISTEGDAQVTRVSTEGDTQVGRVSDAGDDAVATVESAIVSTVEDRDRAEAAATGAEASASEAASSAVAADESAGESREWARQSEESAGESESSSVVSLDSSAAAVAAAKVLLEWEAPDVEGLRGELDGKADRSEMEARAPAIERVSTLPSNPDPAVLYFVGEG